MSDTTIIYLIDDDGDYVVDQNGDRIILGEVANLELATEEDIAKGLRLARRDVPYIKNFDIDFNEGSGEYTVKYNYEVHGGIFPNVGLAWGQVLGTYIQNGNREQYEQALITINDSGPIETAYTVGMERLGDRLTKDARLAFVGDSTTDSLGLTAGGTCSRLYGAATLTWTPDKWKGFMVPMGTSQPQVNGGFGSAIRLTANRPSALPNGSAFLAPGQTDWFDSIDPGYTFKSSCPFRIPAGTTSDSSWIASFGHGMDGMASTGQYTYLDAFKEADGSFQVFLNDGEDYDWYYSHLRTDETVSASASYASWGTGVMTDYIVMDQPVLKLGTGNNTFSYTGATYNYDTTPAPAGGYYNTWHKASGTLANSAGKAAMAGKSVNWGPLLQVRPPAGQNWGNFMGAAPGAMVLSQAAYCDRPDITEGLAIWDFGISGSTAPDHSADPTSGADHDLGYNTTEVQFVHNKIGIDTIHILLGINDAGAAYSKADYKQYVKDIIQRHRDAHTAAGTTREFRAIVTTAPDWRSDSFGRSLMALYRDACLEIAREETDVACIDMWKWWKDNFGEYDTYEGTYLIDGTHQNALGGKVFASQIWQFIADGAATHGGTP